MNDQDYLKDPSAVTMETPKLDSNRIEDVEGRREDELEPLTLTSVHRLVLELRAQDVQARRQVLLLIYLFILLVYIGLNAALLGANQKPQAYIEENYYLIFHMTSFWAVFVFTLMEALLLISVDKIVWSNKFQFLIVMFNVMTTFTTALLFTIYPREYEVPAHYMEYSAQIFISSVNVIFVRNYTLTANMSGMFYKLRHVEIFVAWLMVTFSFFQLFIYSGLIPVAMGGERAGHMCEFCNEIFNGGFAFVYTLVLYSDVTQDLNRKDVGAMNNLGQFGKQHREIDGFNDDGTPK